MANLYFILLPHTTVADGTQHRAWEEKALHDAGGYTLSSAVSQGAWRDPRTGVVHRDILLEYRVACNADTWAHLVLEAHRLFPDEIEIFNGVCGIVFDDRRPFTAEEARAQHPVRVAARREANRS